MDVNMINARGGFDRLLIDGSLSTMPLSGVTLNNDESLLESIHNDPKIHEHSLMRLRVNLIGEINEGSKDFEAIRFRDELDRIGVKCLLRGKTSRYCIGYVSLIILKCNNYFDSDSISDFKSEQSMELIAKKIDEASILIAALRLSKLINSTWKNDCKDSIVAIIDKVFVHQRFRNLGVSKWLHRNMSDIVQTYSLQKPNACLLYYADFLNEAGKLEMSEEKYLEMLHNHYLKEGYQEFNKLSRLKDGIDAKRIMYKLYDTKI